VPLFRITVVNKNFSACDEHDLGTTDEARTEGIKGALAIGSDEIVNGKEFFGAEVKVERDNQLVGRFVVSVGASAIEQDS